MKLIIEPDNGVAPLRSAIKNAKESVEIAIFRAHHFSAIRHADIILVLQDCELVEQGTHGTLLASNGVYAELHSIQTSEGAKLATGQLLSG